MGVLTATWRTWVKGESVTPAKLNTPITIDITSSVGNYIYGLELSNNSTDSDHDIDISAGQALDSTNSDVIILGAFTKQLDGGWTQGTNQGGLDTGSIAADTWYHMYAIAKPDGLADAIFSTNATTPSLPAGYTLFRRIGSVLTDSSANIVQFFQNGDIFHYNTPRLDIDVTAGALFDASDTLPSTPLGIETIANVSVNGSVGSGSVAGSQVVLYPEIYGSVAYWDAGIGNSAGTFGCTKQLFVNSSQQVRRKCNFTTGSLTYTVYVNYYIDARGK